MADPDQDQDDLVSQDDIDKLLASSDSEAAEENLETVDISSETEETAELSQDDIDSLMGSQTSGNVPDDAEEADGELSQDDIDSLLNSNAGDTQTGGTDDTDAAGDTENTEDDDKGELSQDDIDSLLGGGPVGLADDDQENGNTQDSDQADIDQDDDQEIELIDQADIDQLLNPDQDLEPPPESSETETMNAGTTDAAAPAQTPAPETAQTAGDGFVIGADQAADAADCLIAQETLDTLMQNAPETAPAPDPVILDQADTAEQTAGDALDQVDLDAEMLDMAETSVSEPDADDVTQDDIDALLRDPAEQDSAGDDKAEQSQEGGDEDAGSEDAESEEDADDILISQNDIDTLLMSSDQEDEDILGNLSGEDFDDMLENDVPDEDMDETDGEADGWDSDQVVLEKADPADAKDSEAKIPGKGSKWYRSKLLLAAASVLLMLAIAVPAAYFLFFPKPPELPAVNEQMAMIPDEMAADVSPDREQPPDSQGLDIAVESVDVDVAAVTPRKISGNMVLENFIVLASDRSEQMAYVTMDIAIDYSDRRAYDDIHSNLAFFRDVIYDAIQQNLVWEKRDAVTQNDLIKGVETGLKKVLPPEYIENIRFLSFEAS